MKLYIPSPLSSEALSGVSGSISIACWVIVFSPQLYDTFRRQNTDDQSLSFLWLWFIGDLLNILGCVLQDTLPTMTILAIYNAMADVVMIFQTVYYRRHRIRRYFVALMDGKDAGGPNDEPEDVQEETYSQSVVVPLRRAWKTAFFKFGIALMVVLAIVTGLYIATDGHLYDAAHLTYRSRNAQPSYVGQVAGWCCTVIYVGSRIPQIVLNFAQKTCHETSIIYFFFASLGNIMFVFSIVIFDSSFHYLLLNASWLCGTLLSLVLDHTIFFQTRMYRRPPFDVDLKSVDIFDHIALTTGAIVGQKSS
ncbi:PQ loop repeat-domain-containing protein [Dipodascopsis tothii]|uniref:PQ loop repeat-domain-containing protein n=1 Tax=Dipodascopsis tothii TaxID=44089 RepID=UPI0034CD60EC